ncbi:benzoate 1,2-dioxygenase electron transfer component BenC [Pseudonocardia sp. H11422]|uniref:benzoate 1,2-dioxygenase electron transfer component BenC n=1 Tax=Pseudonocardia sp. H11422 TaxID=2835866 RepID=UPI0020279E6A|nr:benzoate 1,2-dioxygenase electron transfer component BenC [Pseudonocardia sp. H11422]
MSYQIALTFEDGVTRFIEGREGETVADASYRSRINIPLDCRDGVCGTCKSFCESGRYELGDYVPDEAMTEDEEQAGYVLTCQMFPRSDLVIQIPVTSDIAKAGVSAYSGRITGIDHLSDTTMGFSIALDNRDALGFLPGQYVNVVVPGTDQTRSYSFSSGPGADHVGFLLRNTPTGALPSYLREKAKAGDRIEFTGPLGSFYLRDVKRPLLFLAGGTGLAPFLAMLEKISGSGTDHPVHLIYGVTNDADLIKVDELEQYAKQLPNFTFTCCVADEGCSYPNKGYVTRYIEPQHVNGGDVDIYLCGPPPMVDAVRQWLESQGIAPLNFYYEKFSGSTGLVTETGAVHLKVGDVEEAFDARMALELGAAQLTVGRLSEEQIAEYRRLAEATVSHVGGGHFTDVAGFRETNAAFHLFPIQATGNATMIDTYRRLQVQEYMAQALTPSVELTADIAQDHRDMVDASARGDLDAARTAIVTHTEHAKATMRAGIEAQSERAGSTG